MDKLLAFCHFCELHGPSVILCTHWVSESDINEENWLDCDTRTQSFSSYCPSLSSASNQPIVSEIRIDGRDTYNTCEGCSLKSKSMVNAFNGFLSLDAEKKYGYVTSSQPLGESFRQITPSMMKEACVRSLSCEVYEKGREGVVYFGDDVRAHVLSHLFVLRDSKARGFQRTYSICVMSLNKRELLRDWDFLAQHIERVISKLKEKARVVYESELTQTTCQQRRSLILDNVTNIGSTTGTAMTTGGSEEFEPRNALNTQRSNSKARSLLELTGDHTTFAAIHMQFSWLLNALQSQYTIGGCDDEWFGESCCDEWYLPSQQSINKTLSLRHYYKIVGKENFRHIAHSILIGKQIIICNSNKYTLKWFIFGLSQLIPDECINAKTYSDVYDERWSYNFIGISDISILPSSVVESSDHLIVILEHNSSSDTSDDNLRVFLRSSKQHKLPERLPNFLLSVERVLSDVCFSDTCFDAFVMSLKQEWLNKVHTIYGFTKNLKRSARDINSLMSVLNIEDCDRKLIEYWLHSGLSFEFKTKVFAINNQTEQPFTIN